ncbi:MAG: TonB-dependent receptor [Gemmatimonadetes bacterium]|nr:TonB-dependent receptor [Gemmatimonadota bacterium]
MTATAAAALLLHQTVVAGVVRDSVGIAPLEGAQVTIEWADDARSATGVTDSYGAFVISVPNGGDGGMHLRVELPGYAPWERAFDPLPEDAVNVVLAALPAVLEGLEVAGAGIRFRGPLSSLPDRYVVDAEMVRTVPTVVVADVMRVTELSPAASSTSDMASVPYIRGVAAYGTPLTLDGIRLFNPLNLTGFFSSLPPSAIARVEVVPGSAGEGIGTGSLSGAMRVSTRDGSRDRRRVVASIGAASAGVVVEGPMGEGKSYLVVGRRSYIDAFARGMEMLGLRDRGIPYFFQDLLAKIATDRGDMERLSVTGYLSTESFNDLEEFGCPGLMHGVSGNGSHFEEGEWEGMLRDTDLGGGAVSVRYRRRIGSGGMVDATVGHSWFRNWAYELDHCSEAWPPTDTVAIDDGGMRQTSAEVRATWRSRRATMVAAVQASGFAVDQESFGLTTLNFYPLMDIEGSLGRFAAYGTVAAPLGAGIVLGGGLRADHFGGTESTAGGFAELQYELGSWSARAAASRSRQALGSLRAEERPDALEWSFDLLFPVGNSPVSSNTEFTAGVGGTLGGLRLRVDGYLRDLDHLRLIEPHEQDYQSPIQTPDEWHRGSADMGGVEVSWSLVHTRGLSLLGGYRWARVVYETERRGRYTPRFHRDHELELAPSLSYGAHTWSARVSLRSPIARGLPIYRRVDVGWGRDVGSWAIRASVANLFFSRNALGIWPPRDPGGAELRQDGITVPLPFLEAEFRW